MALFGKIGARARTFILASAAAVAAVVALIAGTSGFLGAKASDLFRFGSGSSVSQRYGYWAAALRIGAHHL